MNAAKMLVWVMSGMLIALLAVLVVGLSLGWHKDDTASEPALTSRSFSEAEPGFGLVDLDQPTGTSVAGVETINGWIALTLTGGGIPDRVVFLNARTGKVEGEIALRTSYPSLPSP